jgi:DNA-binding transcriptional ArsR family regulator
MKPVLLKTKRELDIYVNPQRQNILRCMRIAGEPVTPKQISDRIGISASSVQYHMQKLLEIGLAELIRTESIHGITARFYAVTGRTVSIGVDLADGQREDRLAVLQNALTETYRGFTAYCAGGFSDAALGKQFGDMLYGIVHLEPEDAKRLYAIVGEFIRGHETKTPRSEAWEYALLAYPVQEDTP